MPRSNNKCIQLIKAQHLMDGKHDLAMEDDALVALMEAKWSSNLNPFVSLTAEQKEFDLEDTLDVYLHIDGILEDRELNNRIEEKSRNEYENN